MIGLKVLGRSAYLLGNIAFGIACLRRSMSFESKFNEAKPILDGLKKIALFKQIEKVTFDIWSKDGDFEKDRDVLGTEENARKKVVGVVKQNWEGIADHSEEYWKVLDVAIRRQELTRVFIKLALEHLDHGFNQFDAALIHHSSNISSLYDKYYPIWQRAVNGNEVASRLKKEQETLPKEFFNHYTIIDIDNATNQFVHSPLAVRFQKEIAAIVEEFDRAIAKFKTIPDLDAQQQRYIDYFCQYRKCLAETEIDKLESEWKELDRVWMDIKYYIQIIHDIEEGYGEPLRTKINPDFSLRIVDEVYSKENQIIEGVKQTMYEYFSKRNKALANKGLFALQNSFAAIYYLPFVCSSSLSFRFSGQSIPNRADVKDEKGVKIYFDPVSTAERIEQTKTLVSKVFADPSVSNCIDTVNTIIYHVAAHEFGHAIYGLGHLRSVIRVETKTLLEEPRAELTALVTMKLLQQAGQLNEAQVNEHLLSYTLQELRRFAMFDNSSLRPYIISAINTFNQFERLGYLKFGDDGKLVVDESKSSSFLQYAQELFEKILDAEDNSDGQTLELLCKQMQQPQPLVEWLVRQLFHCRP